MTASSIITGKAAAVDVVAGYSVVLHYGDVAAEYAALRSRAMLVDHSARGRLVVNGPRAAELIGGLVTNDVQALTPGHGQYAAALTPKGKIVADVRIFARDGSLLIDVPPRAREGWQTTIKKYINPRLAPYQDVSATLRQMGVYGIASRSVVAKTLGVAPDVLAMLSMYSHTQTTGDASIVIARVPDLALEGYELFVPAEVFDSVWQRLMRSGATPAGLAAWEIARIEAGRPEWGIDMDATTIPQEANFDELGAISYTKGCYVGQEVVARVHFRGHVNKHLRGLLCGETEPPPTGATLLNDAGKPVGDVRSTAISPRLGAIALAIVRREVESGATLAVHWEGGEAQADVSALPFPL